jgi:phosphatidylglycerophosphatase A
MAQRILFVLSFVNFIIVDLDKALGLGSADNSFIYCVVN